MSLLDGCWTAESGRIMIVIGITRVDSNVRGEEALTRWFDCFQKYGLQARTKFSSVSCYKIVASWQAWRLRCVEELLAFCEIEILCDGNVWRWIEIFGTYFNKTAIGGYTFIPLFCLCVVWP